MYVLCLHMCLAVLHAIQMLNAPGTPGLWYNPFLPTSGELAMAVDFENCTWDCRIWVSAIIALATSRSLAANNFTVIQLFLLFLAGNLSVVRARTARVLCLGIISGRSMLLSLGLRPSPSPIAFYSCELFNFTSNRLSTRYRVPARFLHCGFLTTRFGT